MAKGVERRSCSFARPSCSCRAACRGESLQKGIQSNGPLCSLAPQPLDGMLDSFLFLSAPSEHPSASETPFRSEPDLRMDSTSPGHCFVVWNSDWINSFASCFHAGAMGANAECLSRGAHSSDGLSWLESSPVWSGLKSAARVAKRGRCRERVIISQWQIGFACRLAIFASRKRDVLMARRAFLAPSDVAARWRIHKWFWLVAGESQKSITRGGRNGPPSLLLLQIAALFARKLILRGI